MTNMNGICDTSVVKITVVGCGYQPGSMMACHINWHAAVYHVEKANYDAALDIFDNAVSRLCVSDSVDAS